MNILDIGITITICFFGYKGFKNGLIKELGSLLALIAGIFLAIRFSELIYSFVENKTNINTEYIPVISFAIIFIGVVILVLVLSKTLDRFIKVIKLQWLNKLAGIVFSLLKTSLIMGGLLFLIIQTNEKTDIVKSSIFDDSILVDVLINIFEFSFPYIKNITI